MGSNIRLMIWIAPVLKINLDRMKNGSNDGIITFRHRSIAFCPVDNTLSVSMINKIKTNQ